MVLLPDHKSTISVNTAVGTTEEMAYSEIEYALILVPTGSTITALTFHVASELGGTYLALYDAFGDAAVVNVGAAKAYPIPSACQGARAIKMVGDAAGDVVVTWQG